MEACVGTDVRSATAQMRRGVEPPSNRSPARLSCFVKSELRDFLQMPAYALKACSIAA